MQIHQALKWAAKELGDKKIFSAFLDAEVLLSKVIRKDKAFLYSHPEYKLSKNQESKFRKYILRRAKREPIAYIIQQKEFYGLDFYVNKNVLIPRPETEILVEEALNVFMILRNIIKTKKIHILEIGTGSGCIIISLLKNLSNFKSRISGIATDTSKKALRIARQNAKSHQVMNKIKFLQGNLMEPAKHKKIDILIANLPYLMPEQYKNNLDLKYEPKNALVAGKDGLLIINKLFNQLADLSYISGYAPKYILLEIDPGQKEKIKKIAQEKFKKAKIKFVKDLAGKDRIIVISRINNV